MNPAVHALVHPDPSQLCSTPTIPAGGRPPRYNALKHGLRSASVLLPGDDAEVFQRMRDELHDLYRPRTDNEARCVDAMAGHEWCMERCRRWRQIYHGKLDALLRGEPDSAGGVHCERDPHRWHHSAMDCALEEGRLGRLQERERRKLAELQKLRRQRLLEGLEEAERDEGALPAARLLDTSGGPPVYAESTAPHRRPPVASQADARPAMSSTDDRNGKFLERTLQSPVAALPIRIGQPPLDLPESLTVSYPFTGIDSGFSGQWSHASSGGGVGR